MDFYEVISFIIFGTMTYVWYSRQEAVKTKDKAELIVKEKNKIIDEAFIYTSMSLVTRIFKDIFEKISHEMEDKYNLPWESAINEISERYNTEILKLREEVNLSDAEIKTFVNASYVSTYLNDFSSEFSKISKKAFEAILFGFALIFFVYSIGEISALPQDHLVFIYISKLPLTLIWAYLIIIFGIVYINTGILNIYRLNQLTETLDKINKAKDLDTLYDVF